VERGHKRGRPCARRPATGTNILEMSACNITHANPGQPSRPGSTRKNPVVPPRSSRPNFFHAMLYTLVATRRTDTITLASMPKIAIVCAQVMACACSASLVSHRLCFIHSHTLTHSALLTHAMAPMLTSGAGDRPPHVHTRPCWARLASLASSLHAMQCPLSRSLAPSLSAFVVTPIGTQPTFPSWASRS
jgi:hypothetical protein